MPYLGNVPAEAYTNTVKDSFNGDASTTAFTLSQPSTTNNLRVVVENVIQDPTVAYTVSGTTLTFTSAPPVGTANIYAVHLGPATQTAVPPSEINNATTYTSDLTVQGAFTSVGIDDNADATAMTIDSSENVLVGTTTRTNLSNGTGNTGHSLDNAGQARHTADSGEVMFLNRLTDDGDIAVFRKDGTTVGSIGTAYGFVTVGGGDTGLLFQPNQDSIRPWNMSTNASKDASVVLGASTERFKDLYLSGGVYLGGTGSANLLQSYEQGNWTPEYKSSTGSHPTITYNVQVGRYTKVGRMVHVQGRLRTTSVSGGSGEVQVANLPFTSNSDSDAFSVPTIGYAVDWTTNNTPTAGYVLVNNTAFRLVKFNTSDPRASRNAGINVSDLSTGSSDNDILFSLTYITD